MPRTILYTLITLEAIGTIGGFALAFYGFLAGNQFWAAITFIGVCCLVLRLGYHLAQVL